MEPKTAKTTFEDLTNDLVCFVLDKTLKAKLPGIDSASLASFACVSTRYARLVKERAWERACRKALPDVCKVLNPGERHADSGAAWASFAKLLTRCPGYQMKKVAVVGVRLHVPPAVPGNFWEGFPFVGPKGQTKTLKAYAISLASHISDDWASSESVTLAIEDYFEEGRKVFPGLCRKGGGVFLLSSCEITPPHGVTTTYSKWYRSNGKDSLWNVSADEDEYAVGHARIDPRTTIVSVYRGMVADVSALKLSDEGRRLGGFSELHDDIPSALDAGRKELRLKTPATAQCPFCSETMRHLDLSLCSKKFHGTDIGVPPVSEFLACSARHVYGASVEEIYDHV